MNFIWLVSNFPNHFSPRKREVYELKTNNLQTLTATHVSCSIHLVSFLDTLTCETRPHPFSSWRETIFSSVTWFVIHSVQYRIKNFNSLIFDILVQISAIFHMQYTYEWYFFFNKSPFHTRLLTFPFYHFFSSYHASFPYPSEFALVLFSPSKFLLYILYYIFWKYFTATPSCVYCAMYFYTNQE